MADDADVTVQAKKEKDSGSGSSSGAAGGSRNVSGGRAPTHAGRPKPAKAPPPPPEPYIPFVSGTLLDNPPTEEDLAEITVESTVPTIGGDLLQLGNPRGLLSFGNALTPPFRTGYVPYLDRPPSLGQPPSTAFAPAETPLPEVTVSAKPPTSTGPPRALSPGALGAFIGGLAGWAFWFLTVPRVANIDERSKTDAALRRRIAEIAAGLQPIVPSVTRLPDPLAEVTVSARKLSGNAPVRRTRGVRTDVTPRLSPGRVGFQPSPNSFLYPPPQRTKDRFPITSEVTFGTSTRPLVGSTPRPRPVPTVRTPRPIPTPIIPGLPGGGVVGGQPGVGLITPVVPQPFTPGTLTQFQPQPTGGCNCTTTKTKPDRKPRKPRTVCYRGTYVEFSNGTSKKQLEQVPCESKAAARARQPKKPRAPRKPKLKPGQFPGMGVF